MQYTHAKQTILKAITLTVFSLALFASSAKAGGEVYEIYLNNKLILKQFLYQPLNLKSLPLDKSNYNDQLTIYYSQCNVKIAKGRTIVVKDEKGNTLKEWKFADATETHAGMTIPVKDLFQLVKSNGNSTLSLYYNAEGRSKEQILTSFQIGGKTTAFNSSEQKIWSVLNREFLMI
ncbi:MAG TPA: hypothetical protein VMI12_16935 [Puia sp.]|nr:hypothetical protein [Puia sp.]